MASEPTETLITQSTPSIAELHTAITNKVEVTQLSKQAAKLWQISWCLPFLSLLWFIARYGVNLFVMDEWGSIYRAYRVFAYRRDSWSLMWSCIWLPNNEHRILFPNLIWAALALVAKADRKVIMFFDAGLALITLLAFYKIGRKQNMFEGRSIHGSFIFTMLLTSLMLFSWIQWENWLWGWGLPFILPQTCVALAILFLYSETLSPRRRFLFAAVCCFIASFSALQGLCSWLAVIPCVFAAFEKARWKALGLWLILFGATALIYFYRLPRFEGDGIGNSLYALHHLRDTAVFYLGMLGAPLAQGYQVPAPEMGLFIGITLLAVLFWCLYKLRRELFSTAAPWLSCTLYGLGFVFLATMGRSVWGFAASQGSRYTSMTVFAFIGVIQLCGLVFSRNQRIKNVGLVAGGALISMVLTTTIAATQTAEQVYEGRSKARLLLEVAPYIDPALYDSERSDLLPAYPLKGHLSWLREPLAAMGRIKWLRVENDVRFVENAPYLDGSFDSIGGSDSSGAVRKDDIIIAKGCAALPELRRMPQLVLISYGDQKTFVSGAVVGSSERPDVAKFLGSRRYLKCGWEAHIPAELLPVGEDIIKAWVYDSYRKQFIRLAEYQGPKRVRVQP